MNTVEGSMVSFDIVNILLTQAIYFASFMEPRNHFHVD